ncbi:MAG: Rne/Rng family ribonuclease [Ignavibacteriales bacterium]
MSNGYGLKVRKMQRQLVIESYPWETRLAIVEDGRLVELHYEDKNDRVGNMYKGRVKDILPGLSCAFVDLGFDKNAFLYQGDLRGARPEASVKDLLSRGQELLVQVKKEAITGKGARVTTSLTIPGHYLVLLPFQNEVSVSRKIKDPITRNELRDYLKNIKPEGFGLIVRTAGVWASLKDLQDELDSLLVVWQEICTTANDVSAPALVYKDLDIVQRTLRDYIDGVTDTIIVNTQEQADGIKDQLNQDSAARGIDITVMNAPFDVLGLETEVEKLTRTRVWLKSGGYLVIEETEAMVVIDINSGKYTGKRELNETIFKTNLEAAKEIPRQMRLRAIGGIILMDFIDMKEKKHREEVLKVLSDELQKDKAHSRVLGITRLGLVEMTRKKTRGSISTVLAEECQYCEGKGRIINHAIVARELMRRLINLSHREADTIRVEVRPELMPYLDEEAKNVALIKRTLGKELNFISNPELPAHFTIQP